MPPYLMRKRTLPTRNSQESQLKEQSPTSKVKSKKIVTRSSSNMNKQDSKSKKKKVIKQKNKNIANSRQMSLRESFLNQSKVRVLRSHKNSKNPTNNKLVKKLSPNKRKPPIYKCSSPESPKENNNEIYEFKFDVNDSTERIPKKRKKGAAIKKTIAKRKKRNVPVKQVSKEQSTSKPEKIKKTNVVKFEGGDHIESLIKNRNDVLKEELVEKPKTNVDVDKEVKDLKNIVREENADDTVTKPTIISIEDLSDRRISITNVSKTSASHDFKPFRPTNIFNNKLTIQKKDALNYSLFEKSLSPIVKLVEDPQISSSPWRAAPLLTFSQVKNVFQSTPQNDKYDVINKKFLQTLNNESKQFGNITKIKNSLQKNNENINIERHISNSTPKRKNLVNSRKFGTEITNIDHSLQFKSSIEQINERISTETENIQLNTTNVTNICKFDNNENKTKNVLSPKNGFKREATMVKTKINQGNILNMQFDKEKKEYDSQPGPSGLQGCSISNRDRVLRQSNLNNFLNVMEMPQSTSIKTPHGIFDDAQSTSIISRTLKKANVSTMELKNAFGFSDNDSNQEESPIKPKSERNKGEKPIQTDMGRHNIKPIRLSIGEIKNKLLTKELKEDIHNKENILIEKKEVQKLEEKNKKSIEIVNFSDTFDVLSETGERSVVSAHSIPLFADLEPSHFTQPPRHSYKRKRDLRFNFLEEEDEEEEEKIRSTGTKRKKTDKLKKDQEERLLKWVQDINKTFSEIDQHELVVE